MMKSRIIQIVNSIEDVDNNYSNQYREDYLRFTRNRYICNHLNTNVRTFQELIVAGYVGWSCAISEAVIDNIDSQLVHKQSSIYVTIHLGPYKAIPRVLLKKGMNVCIHVTERVFFNQKKEYDVLVDDIEGPHGSLEFVNIENKQGLIKMLKLIKQGFSVLFYIDGNSGIGGMERNDEKLLDYEFAYKTIKIRKGIDFFTNKLGLPIIPVVSYLEFNNNWTYKSNIIVPQYNSFSRCSTTHIAIQMWDLFSEYINKYASQWEAWLYIDAFFKEKEWTKINCSLDTDILRFNNQRYDFFSNSNGIYLYDILNNTKVAISQSLFDILIDIKKSDKEILKDDFLSILRGKDTLMESLINYQIMI